MANYMLEQFRLAQAEDSEDLKVVAAHLRAVLDKLVDDSSPTVLMARLWLHFYDGGDNRNLPHPPHLCL